MNYELLFGGEVQLFLSLSAFLLVLSIVGFVLDEDASPQVVVLVGIGLITVAGAALWYVDWMKGLVATLHDSKHISDAFASEFESRSNLFMFVFPFASAAIGTNLISDVLTKKLHYEKPLTFSSVLRAVPDFVGGIVGFFILVPVVALLAPLLFVSPSIRQRSPQIIECLKRVNRRVYLKVLKIDIVIRNWRSNKGMEPTR